MANHKFHLDEIVHINASPVRNIAGGAYIVTKQLPERDGEFEYRVKSVTEPHERVVQESDLVRPR
jgi:hypothetical protein